MKYSRAGCGTEEGSEVNLEGRGQQWRLGRSGKGTTESGSRSHCRALSPGGRWPLHRTLNGGPVTRS